MGGALKGRAFPRNSFHRAAMNTKNKITITRIFMIPALRHDGALLRARWAHGLQQEWEPICRHRIVLVGRREDA